MQLRALLMAAVGGMAGWVLIGAWIRGRKARLTALAIDRALHPERYPPRAGKRPQPEAAHVVRVTETEIVCERPGGVVEHVRWSDLVRVEIVTTSRGPRAADVFWVLHGDDGGCAVPQGATGERGLLESLQALPGFDNQAVIRAMSSSADARWVCWTKATA